MAGIARRLALIIFSALTVVAAGTPPAFASFPGTDGRIVFARYSRSNIYEEIYITNASGGGVTRLTDSGGRRASNVYPDWNANGKRIAYHHATFSTSKIVIMKPNGREVDSFGDRSCAGGAGTPSWSPDGHTIAYSCPDGSNGQYIKTFDLLTHARTQITPDGGFDTTPEFSPAGNAIAYAAEGPTGGELLNVVYLDPSGLPDHAETVAGDAVTSAGDPDWTPDGNTLVYSCTVLVPPFDQDLCTAPVASPHSQTVIVNGHNLEQFPAVSPSGTQLVWDVGPEESDTELKVAPFPTGPAMLITSNMVTDEEADWGPG